LKSTETLNTLGTAHRRVGDFSNFGSLKSTETPLRRVGRCGASAYFSNFGSLKSTETREHEHRARAREQISAISAR